ncbi:MAG: hypothetical protein ACREM3_26190 [Candidatus Rokuibacteriota bacterium]
MDNLEREMRQKDKEHILTCFEMIRPQCIDKSTAEIRELFVRYKMADKLVSYYDVLGGAIQSFLQTQFVAVPTSVSTHIWTEPELLTVHDELRRMKAAESRVKAQVSSRNRKAVNAGDDRQMVITWVYQQAV